jgi:large subunit ribosomal protein L30
MPAAKHSQDGKTLLVTYTRSSIGRPQRQRRTIRALGLKKLHDTVQHRDTTEMRAMIGSVQHLVTVRETEGTPVEVPKPVAAESASAEPVAAAAETPAAEAEAAPPKPKRTRTRKATSDETA